MTGCYHFDSSSPCLLSLNLIETVWFYDRPLIQLYQKVGTEMAVLTILLDDCLPETSLWLLVEMHPDVAYKLLNELSFEKAISLKDAVQLAPCVYYCTGYFMDSVASRAEYFKVQVDDLPPNHVPAEGSYIRSSHYLEWKNTRA